MQLWKESLGAFLFPAKTDRWLSCLRIGLGLQVLLYALSLQGDWHYLFAGINGGLNGRGLSEGLLSTQSPLVPRLGWVVTLGSHVGLSEWVVLSVTWWLLVCAASGLTAGFFCRSSAIMAWFLHLCAAKSGGLVSYGVDNFMTIGLFYLMLSPLPDRLSLDWTWLHFRMNERHRWTLPAKRSSHLLGFWRRVLQIHLCLIYFFGGLTKALGSGWWDGSNLWRALVQPPFNIISPDTLVRWKYLFPVAGVCICILETSYPFFIWGKKTRNIWLIGICAMHVAIGATMGLYLFALIMIILNLAAFGPDFTFGKKWSAIFANREIDRPTNQTQSAV